MRRVLLGSLALVLASALLPSLNGVQEIQQHEGTVQRAYLDAVGVPTICTGSTTGVKLGTIASTAECTDRLRTDLKVATASVQRVVDVPLTQDQFDALVSLTFNIGGTNLKSSTLVRKLNAGDCYGAAKEFNRWVYAKGQKLPGLVSRRERERQYFEPGCVQNRPVPRLNSTLRG